MAKTIVGLYDDRTTAMNAMRNLEKTGIDKDNLRFTSHEKGESTRYDTKPEELARPKHLARWGVPDDEARFYSEGVRRGGSLVVARVHDNDAERVADLMAQHNPVRYEDRKAHYSDYDEKAAPFSNEQVREERSRHAETGKRRMQEVEEHLKTGKREKVRGGVRVHKHVDTNIEEETLRLRDEKVDVERRNVDRPLSGAEADRAFREEDVEMVERVEEPVVTKEARVTGEVEVGKDSRVREETVRGEVRSTHIDVDRIPEQSWKSAEPVFRQHYDKTYSGTDHDWSYYQPAYRYGYAAGNTYTDGDFNRYEPGLRQDYKERHGKSSRWEDVRDAVRHGFSRART